MYSQLNISTDLQDVFFLHTQLRQIVSQFDQLC